MADKGSRTSVNISMGGTAVITCIHGKSKRAVIELEFDNRIEFVHLCPCCENLFTTSTDEPYFCSDCGDRPIPGGSELPKGVH